MKFPTAQEQIEYWNTKERLEHERVMDIRAESPNQSTETGAGQQLADTLTKVLDVLTGDQAAELGVYDALARWFIANPQQEASTTAKSLTQLDPIDAQRSGTPFTPPLTQEEEEERKEATAEWFEEIDRKWLAARNQ